MGQTTRRLGFVGIALALIVTETEAAVINFACGGRDTLTKVVRFLSPGDVLLVSGNCVENVFIGSTVGDVTLDGQNVATVSGATTTSASFIVRGRNITIRNFTITGGSDGVFFTDGGSG